MTLMATDVDLARDLARQDPAAVQALIDRYWARAYRVALHITQDPAAAEDAAQETLIQVSRQAADLRDPGAFRAWFFRCLENHAKKQRRAQTRRRKHEAHAASAEPTAAATPVDDRERDQVVRAQLGALSPKYRAALSLRYLEGLSLPEIAHALDCPEGTVSSRIRRGLESLRERLDPALALGAAAPTEWLRQALAGVEVPQAPQPIEFTADPTADVPLPPAAQTVRAAASRRSPWLAALVAVALGGLLGSFLLDPADTPQPAPLASRTPAAIETQIAAAQPSPSPQPDARPRPSAPASTPPATSPAPQPDPAESTLPSATHPVGTLELRVVDDRGQPYPAGTTVKGFPYLPRGESVVIQATGEADFFEVQLDEQGEATVELTADWRYVVLVQCDTGRWFETLVEWQGGHLLDGFTPDGEPIPYTKPERFLPREWHAYPPNPELRLQAGQHARRTFTAPRMAEVRFQVEGVRPADLPRVRVASRLLESSHDSHDVAEFDAESGLFRTLVYAGDVEFRASCPGYAPLELTRQVTPGESFELTLALEPAQHRLFGTVRAPDGSPIAGAQLSLGVERTRSDAQGHYELRTDGRGGTLDVRADDHVPAALTVAPYSAPLDQPVVLRRAGAFALRVVDAEDQPQLAKVVLRVDADREGINLITPLSGEIRELGPNHREHIPSLWNMALGPINGFRIFEGRTRSDGTIELRGLPPGDYQVKAGAEASWVDPDGWTTLVVRPGETTRQTLVPAAR